MGNWTVQSVNCRHDHLNNAKEYGTNWYVTYRLKYSPTAFGGFTEPPKMAWDEVILYNDYEKGEHWSFSGNFYTRKPDSPTMAVWAQRYFRAYLNAHGTPFQAFGGKQKGHSKLFDKNGIPVTGAKLGMATGEAAQNKIVQDYLRRNGGILEIEVHDIPNVLKPAPGKNKDVERVLIFNCGVTGGGPRAQGWQHIIMRTSDERNWTYNFQLGTGAPGLKTTGLKVVPDPTPRGDLLPTGGIW